MPDLKTHYVRLRAPFHRRLASPLEGLVYQAVPDDRLVTFEDVWGAVRGACPKNGTARPVSRKALEGVLAGLAERGFVCELHGVKLNRLVQGAPCP